MRFLVLSFSIYIICMTLDVDIITSANAQLITATSASVVNNKVRSIRCRFTTNYSYGTLRNAYTCEISGRLVMTHRGMVISSAEGEHLIGRKNTDVYGFKGDASVIHYFPKNIDKIFPNLQAILLNLVQLKEIRQSDLKPFTDLRYLDLFENKIEFLEADLFKFNKKLEVVWLSNNKIKFVDDTVFFGLTGLKSLYMGYNECVSKSVTDDANKLAFFLDMIRIVCGNKSNMAKYDPKNSQVDDDYDDSDDQQQDQNSTDVVKTLQTQLRTMEDEVFNLKRKREQALIWLVQFEDENRELKKQQNASQKLITDLRENLKKSESTGVDFVKQIFGLRDEMRKQTEATNNIVVGIKNDYAVDRNNLKLKEEENRKLQEQNTKLTDENKKLIQNYDDLKTEKAGRDIITIVVIVAMALVLIGIVGINFYKKYRTSPITRTFNDFENASMNIKLVNDGASGSN